MVKNNLFEDIFRVEKLNSDDKKLFDKGIIIVFHICVGSSILKFSSYIIIMHLDINSEIYLLKVG